MSDIEREEIAKMEYTRPTSYSEIPNSSEAAAWSWENHGRQVTVDKAFADELISDGEIVRPLIFGDTHPASAAPDEEYLRALQDAFDIIQADANTEENYGSMCRIGSVLGKLKDTPTNADVWIKCSERLPKVSDGDCHGIVWVYNKGLSWVEISDLEDVKFISDYTHWMPTNLVRPEPPKEQDDE